MELAEVGRAQQLRPQACQCKPQENFRYSGQVWYG